MIYFIDKNNPNYIAYQLMKEGAPILREASDADRIAYVQRFVDEYWAKHEENPCQMLIEKLSNFILRPYIGRKDMDYKILSSYSLDRSQQKEVKYVDELAY